MAGTTAGPEDDAVDVGSQGLAVEVERQLVDGAGPAVATRVEVGHVEPAALLRRLDGAGPQIRVVDAAHHRSTTQGIGHAAGQRLVAFDGDDGGALRHEQLGRHPTDAGSGAGHDGGLVVQSAHGRTVPPTAAESRTTVPA